MQYYKLVASLAEVDAAAARKKAFGKKAVLSAKSNAFNEHFHDRAFFYVADIIDNVLTVGIICAEDIDINKQFLKYADALDMALNESLQAEEITIHTVRTLLSRAERNSYIEDAEKSFRTI